jgi:adenylosuccinate synthase
VAQKIGTTGKGIGPSYEDKIARRALRVQDLKHPERFATKLRELLNLHNHILVNVLGSKNFDFGAGLAPYMKDGEVQFDAVYEEAMRHAELLKPMIADVSRELNAVHAEGGNLLFEGAQGTLLDVDHGTYPYVTSSNCVAGNAPQALAWARSCCTTSWASPRPTAPAWAAVPSHRAGMGKGRHSRLGHVHRGRRKGVTTGRSRRCGWFDAALLKRSAQINGLSGLCITKLDVLDGIEELQLCVGYELDGEKIDLLPLGADDIERCKPIYESIPGWTDSTVGVTDYDKLPVNARRYLDRIAEVTGVPIAMVSTSPDRDHTILMHNPYSAA